MYGGANAYGGQPQQNPSDGYVTRQEFNNYKRFVTMQANSLFVQIEQLKSYIRQVLPMKEMPKQKREMLDKIVSNMGTKIQYLESQVREFQKSQGQVNEPNKSGIPRS